MTTSMTLTRRAKAATQQGFTLIEIMVALVIVGIITIALAYGLSGTTDDTKASLTVNTLMSDMPKAMYSYVSIAGVPDASSGNSGDITDALAQRGVKPETPWGEDWTAKSDADGNVTVTYPIGSGGTDNDLATQIAQKMYKESSTSSMITTVGGEDLDGGDPESVSTTGGDLKIVYNLN